MFTAPPISATAPSGWRLEPWLQLFGAETHAQFVQSAFAALHAIVPGDFVSALQRRPDTECYQLRDSLGRAWTDEWAREQAELLGLAAGGPAGGRVRLLSARLGALAPGNPDAVPRCRELMNALSFQHAVTLTIGWRGDRVPLSLTMHRRAGTSDFSPEEVGLLGRARGYMERAWCLLHERTVAETVRQGVTLAWRNSRRGVVILDVDCRLLWANRAARDSIHAWEHPDRPGEKPLRTITHMPAVIVEACRGLTHGRLAHAPATGWPKPCWVSPPDHPARCALVRLFGNRVPDPGCPNFLVEFQPGSLAASEEPAASGTSFRESLTASEHEIVALVCEGLSNQEIADRLSKSVMAVKFHLHRIFKKAQVKSRTRLSVLLLEDSSRKRNPIPLSSPGPVPGV